MTDLTKIEKPFGLLEETDPDVALALRECGGPWEYFNGGEWIADKHFPSCINKSMAFRQKPQPREYEAWLLIDENGDRVGLSYSHGHATERAVEMTNVRVIRMTGRDE